MCTVIVGGYVSAIRCRVFGLAASFLRKSFGVKSTAKLGSRHNSVQMSSTLLLNIANTLLNCAWDRSEGEICFLCYSSIFIIWCWCISKGLRHLGPSITAIVIPFFSYLVIHTRIRTTKIFVNIH
jgi:hypothetical protein